MTNPKIRVGGEFDSKTIEQGIANVGKAAKAVKETLSSNEVGINIKDAKSKLDALEKQANGLAAALERASKAGKKAAGIDFSAAVSALEDAAEAAGSLDQVLDQVGQSSGGGAAVKNAKELAEHLNRAARAQRELAREGIKLTRDQVAAAKEHFDKLRGSGMRGTGHLKDMQFDEWLGGRNQSYSISARENARNRYNIGQRIGIDLPDPNKKGFLSGAGGRLAGRVAGAAGGMVAGAASGGGFGIGSLAGAAAGMLPGGMILGPLVGALGGIMDKALERALGEATDLSDLRRSLGATTVDFDDLRDQVRHFSEGLGLTYNESAKLARAFGHTANASGQNVGREVGQAAGFARGFGMDPTATVQFFATMKHYGVTSNERDSKRLALSIAEAVTKGGVGPKADEALAAIQNYVQTASRASLTQSNAEAYASFMSSMTGLSAYGVKGDPQAAASIMAKADGALRQGGAFGEASKNFSLGLYQRMLPGFSSFDMDFMNEQGAFGSVGRAFGRDSRAYGMARERGDTRKMRQYDQWSAMGGDQSILSLQMQALERFYGRSTEEFTKAIQTHLGVGAGEASALYSAHKRDGGLGGLQRQLEAAGVDMGKLNTKQIASLAEIVGGGSGAVRAQAGRLLKMDGVSDGDKAKLQQALKESKPEELQKIVLGLTAVHDAAEDEGEKMRRVQADMANSLQRIATLMIPLAVGMNDKLGELVKALAPESEYAKGLGDQQKKADVWDRMLAADKNRIDNFDTEKADFTAKRDRAKRAMEAARARGDTAAAARHQGEMILAQKALDTSYGPGAKERMMDAHNRVLALRNGLTDVSPSLNGAYDLKTGKMGEPAAALPSGGGTGTARAGARGRRRSARPLSDAELAYLRETDRLIGAPAGTSAAQLQHESGLDENARSPAGAQGLSQAMPATIKRFEAQTGRKWRGTRADHLALQRWHMLDGMRRYGNYQDALRDYNAGPRERGAWGSAETRAYVGGVEATRRRYYPNGGAAKVSASGFEEKVPGGADPGRNLAMQDLRIDNRVIVLDRDGNELGNTVTQTQTRVGAPVPAGMGYA